VAISLSLSLSPPWWVFLFLAKKSHHQSPLPPTFYIWFYWTLPLYQFDVIYT
jgi:hypothetical protein